MISNVEATTLLSSARNTDTESRSDINSGNGTDIKSGNGTDINSGNGTETKMIVPTI